MRQYQSVIVRLHGRAREDEEALTDVLNERERTGWRLERLTALADTRVLIVFVRDT